MQALRLPAGSGLIAAVSGGADSTALLLALHALGFRPSVAHLHHGIRGRAADRELRFVQRLARRLKLPFVSRKVDVPAVAVRKRISIEMAARDARRAFFKSVAARRKVSIVATAHTADDQAETVLLRLCRGAGLRGLGGIRVASRWEGIRFIRPALAATHEEAMQFLVARGETWMEDESNRENEFLRNRIRNEILPALRRRVNPSITHTLARTAEMLAEENDALERQAAAAFEQSRSRAGLSVSALRKWDAWLCRRVLQRWLIACGVESEAIDFDLVGRIRGLLESPQGSVEIPVSRGRAVERVYDELICKAGAPRTKKNGSDMEWELRLERANGFTRHASTFGEYPTAAFLSRAKVGAGALRARAWRAGDRMKPIGLSGSKKLQDIFTDAKVPKSERARLPVVECGGEIVWVPGYRVARGWEVESASAPSWRVLITLKKKTQRVH